MATGSTRDFDLKVQEIIEEAFERAGLETRVGYDLETGIRSLNLMLAEWANRGLNLWTVQERTLTLIPNQHQYTLVADHNDILEVVRRRVSQNGVLSGGINDAVTSLTTTAVTTLAVNDIIRIDSEDMLVTSVSTTTIGVTRAQNGTTAAAHSDAAKIFLMESVTTTDVTSDIQMTRLSRDEYMNIPTKKSVGDPVQFYYDRQITPVLNLWPVSKNTTGRDFIVYRYSRRILDYDTLVNTSDLPYRFLPCLVAGLAYYIALKKAPDRVALLKPLYEDEFNRAANEDTDRASLKLRPDSRYLRVI